MELTSSGNAGQVAIDRFAEMMIARMEQMKASDWKKGWIGGASGFAGLPQNVGGRNYSGSNSFFLQLQTAAQGYRLPVYLTFKQAHNLKAHVLKGEKAFPVVYWDVLVKDKNGHKVSSDEYKAMSKEEKKGMDVIPFFKGFPRVQHRPDQPGGGAARTGAETHGEVQGARTSGQGRHVCPCRARPDD